MAAVEVLMVGRIPKTEAVVGQLGPTLWYCVYTDNSGKRGVVSSHAPPGLHDVKSSVQLLYTSWSEPWIGIVVGSYVHRMPYCSCAAVVVVVVRATIDPERAGISCVSKGQLEEGKHL